MSDVDDFMQEFLRAERELYRSFAELEKELWAQFAMPSLHQIDLVEWQTKWDEHTRFERSELAGEKATAIATIRRSSHWVTRARYSLRRTENAWRIDGLAYFCLVCNGSGFSLKGEACSICHGKRYFTPPELTEAEDPAESDNSETKALAPPKQDTDSFMHEFLLAERELYLQFETMEKEFWARFSSPNPAQSRFTKIHSDWDDLAQVETFNEMGLRATVIATVVRVSQMRTRSRFSLIQESSTWRIWDFETECTVCIGKGVAMVCKSGGGLEERVCMLCHGSGWIHPKPYVGFDSNTIHRGQIKP
jgi:hypothetical protein